MINIKEYLKGFSDEELKILVEEINKPTHYEDSPLRKLIYTVWGDNVGIFTLRIIEVLYPLLNEINSRWK